MEKIRNIKQELVDKTVKDTPGFEKEASALSGDLQSMEQSFKSLGYDVQAGPGYLELNKDGQEFMITEKDEVHNPDVVVGNYAFGNMKTMTPIF